MNYEEKDWEMSLQDMLFHVLYKWKAIVLVAVIAGMLLGGVQAVRSRSSNQNSAQGYEANLKSYEKDLVVAEESYLYATQMVENQKSYLQESMLMQLTAYNAYEARISMYITTDYQIMPEMKYQNEDYTESIAAFYKSMLTDGNVVAKVAEELDMEAVYLRELIATSKPSDNMVTLTVAHLESEAAQKAAQLLVEQVEQMKPAAEERIGTHRIEVVQDSVGPYADGAKAVEKREAQEKLLTKYEEKQAKQKTELDAVKSTKPVKTGKSVVKTAVIWGVIGAVAGGVVCAVFWCVQFLLRTTVYSAGELRGRIGIHCLGTVTGGKKFDPITRWLRRAEGRITADSGENTALIAQTLGNYAPDCQTLLICGSADQACMESLAGGIRQELPDRKLVVAGSLLQDAAAAAALQICDGVLLVEVCGKTRYAVIGQERERIETAGRKLIGCVLLDR